MNFIDLIAIVPFYIELAMSEGTFTTNSFPNPNSNPNPRSKPLP